MIAPVSVYRGATCKRVKVAGVTPDTTDESIIRCALNVTREDRSSLFGLSITRYDDDGEAVVTLNTD